MATAPKSKLQIQEAIRLRKEWEIENTVFVVDPWGGITEHVCGPPEDGAENGPRSGDTPVAWINGAPRIVKKYEDLGWQLYKDVAKADGELHVFEAMRSAVQARMRGYPIRGDVGELHTTTVKHLRSLARAGGASHGQAFVIGQGIAPDPEAQKNKIADRMKDMGIGDPRLGPPPEKAKGAKKSEAVADGP